MARTHKIWKEHPDVIRRLYLEEELTREEIGKEYGACIDTVMRVLKEYNIPGRKGMRGARNPAWTGGIRKNKGYLYELKPGHPRAGKGGLCPQHVLAWEEYYKRPLPEGWVVHHLNGIRDDNRPKNLVAYPQKGHHQWLYIQALQKRIREVEEALKNWSPLALSAIEDIPNKPEAEDLASAECKQVHH